MSRSTYRRIHFEQAGQIPGRSCSRVAAGRGRPGRVDDPCAVLSDGNETIGVVLALYGSDARVGQVEADQLRAVGGEPVQELATRRYRLLRHMIRDGFPLGMPEGDQRVGQSVTTDDQSLTAGKLKGYMALRVTRRIDNPQAGHDLIAGLHQFDLVLDRREVAARSR